MASYQIVGPSNSGFGAGLGQGLATGSGNVMDNLSKYYMMKKFFPNGLYGNRNRQTNVNYGKTIANVIGGVEDPSALGDEANQQMSEQYRGQNPGQDDMQDAGEQTTDANGNPVDDNSYNNTVRNALMKKYIPGMSMDQVQRRVLGMPQEKAEKSPSDSQQFTSDIQGAMNGDQTWDEVVKAHPDKVNNIMRIKAGLNLAKGMNEGEAPESSPEGDQGSEMVSVVNPDGIPGQIPKANLDAALKRGFKVAGQ